LLPQVLLMSDELKVDETDCLLCLLVGHEEVCSFTIVDHLVWHYVDCVAPKLRGQMAIRLCLLGILSGSGSRTTAL
jgi:hypothetical protein